MEKHEFFTSYYDIQSRSIDDTFFFFLDNLLKARIELHFDTGNHEYDQEVNLYLAHLLVIFSTEHYSLENKPYVSPFDFDIRKYLEQHPGLRNEYTVYKDNADFALIVSEAFGGYHHKGSYHSRVLADSDDKQKIAQYYSLAATALGHLRGMNETLVHVLYTIGQYIQEFAELIKRVAHEYFKLIESLSKGSFYHLQKEIMGLIVKKEYKEKVDRFLELLNTYRKEASESTRKSILEIVDQIKIVNPDFNFNESML